ncbi:MAG: hypothetical protein NTW21_25795 [Verrucomicrobia bacterium]|nr:hypothetical protein [Verrucomicrobiota bacterium]
MNPNFLEPLHHETPPVASIGVWDDAEDHAENGVCAGFFLPGKRVPEARGQAAPHGRNKAQLGLRIDFKMAVRSAATRPVPGKSFGTEVVKLEPVYDEGPFQANKVISAGQPVVQEERRRDLHGEGKEWGKVCKHPMRWLTVSGAGVGVLLVAALAIHELCLAERQQIQAEPVPLIEETPVEDVTGFEIDGSSEQDARALLADYAKAKTPEEVLPLIRDATRLVRQLKQEWRPQNVPAAWEPPREAAWEVTAQGGKSHGLLSGRMPDFARFCVYFVREGAALKIDWEATQGLGEVSFETLQKGLGSGGVIRTFVSPVDFYSLTFPEAEFRSFKMLSPDREQIVWGYVQRGTPAEAALLKGCESTESLDATLLEQAMTLRMTPGPKGSQKNQWIIGEMLHIDWVSP